MFPTTQWTVVKESGGTSAASRSALEEVCRAYWPPLYAFMRRKGRSPHDAQDLVQGFIERLLQRGDLAGVSPEKGKFRTYLLTSLRNYTIKQAEHDKALKRGGGKVFVPIDAEEAERISLPDLTAESPEAAFDRQWARTTIRRALGRLRGEHIARNKEAAFEVLSPFLEGAEPNEYESAASRLGMKPGAVAVAVHRMRRRLQELLRAEVLQTVGNRADADVELRELLEALARR
jgi:RNA polymerase sigma factor (sigma-70 family)